MTSHRPRGVLTSGGAASNLREVKSILQRRERTSPQPLIRGASANMAPISIKTVLISESVDPRCRSILEQHGIRVTERQNMKKDELIAEIKVRRRGLGSRG